MMEEGRQAPDFSATDDEGNNLTMAAMRGRPIVLHFFALAWSGV